MFIKVVNTEFVVESDVAWHVSITCQFSTYNFFNITKLWTYIYVLSIISLSKPSEDGLNILNFVFYKREYNFTTQVYIFWGQINSDLQLSLN